MSSADRFARRLLQVHAVDVIDETAMLRRCAVYRKAFPLSTLSFPAGVLRSGVVAEWIHRHGVGVEACSVDEVGRALSRGVLPKHVVLHCGPGVDAASVRSAAGAGVLRFRISAEEQLDALAPRSGSRVVVDCAASDWERLAAAVIARPGMELIGLHRHIARPDGVDGADAVIGMVAGLAALSRRYGMILGQVSLSGVSCGATDDVAALKVVAEVLYEIVGDGCALCRYPRPVLALSPAPEELL
jgi:diaminopimelate decarboxylase